MFNKIKKILSIEELSELEKHIEYNNDFREKYIPKKYNQIELVDHLTDDSLDHYISISNRTDGKSFNYINYFIDYAIRTGVGFTLIARHYTVRYSYQKLIQETFEVLGEKYDIRKLHFVRNDFYILVGYADKEIGIITDLNQATDLKYLSNYLKHFPIIVYDEFLALEGDYYSDEWERLKTIYSSINRKDNIPYIKHPKIFYLGNAVNFSSPIIANLNLYNYLENHKINTCQIYDNIILEMRKNESRNDDRNLRAFKEDKDLMTHGEFKINNYILANEQVRKRISKNKLSIIVKIFDSYLRIEYNRDTLEIILSVISYSDNYDFNTELADNTEHSKYLDTNFYDDEHYIKYDKGFFYFDNQYSKSYILSGSYNLPNLDILKIISYYELEILEEKEVFEKQYKLSYEEQTKQALFNKFYGK